jgi:hypothetical protein
MFGSAENKSIRQTGNTQGQMTTLSSQQQKTNSNQNKDNFKTQVNVTEQTLYAMTHTDLDPK